MNKTKKKNTNSQEKEKSKSSRKPSRKRADTPVKNTRTAQPNEKREKRTSHKPSRKSADAPVKDTRTTQPNEKREKAQVKKDKNNLSDNRTAVKEKKVNNKANKQTRSEQKEKKILPNRDNQKNNHNKRKQNSKKKESVYFDKYNKNKFLTDNENKNKIIKNFLATLSAEMNNELLIPANAKLLLAVSGGVDSVAMLDAVFQLAEQYRYEIIICHYNHKLRGMSSVQDEKFVRQLAKQYGLKFLVESGDVKTFAKTHSQSIEQAARTLRYNFFERMANSHQVPYLMLAHTADDSAETVLLNLLRGSGLTGLSGIPIQRTLGRKNQVIRPLMKFKKADLINYAEERELKWHEDETNSLLNFTRNKIRNVLIKDLQKEYNPQIVDTLNRTANIIRLADEFVKEHLTPYLNNFKWSKKKGLLAINIPLFESCGTFIQGEILQAKLKDKFNLGDLSQRMIERIIALPQLEVGSIIEIGKNIIALRDRRQLLFYRDRNEQFREADIFKEGEFELDSIKLKLKKVPKKQVSISNEPNIEFFDFDLVPAVLKLRTWQPGDTFTPLGMSGSMKVSDFLINQKVSLIDKNSVLVLASKSDILWVCGMRISDKFKVKSSTTRFLKVELLDKENNNEQ